MALPIAFPTLKRTVKPEVIETRALVYPALGSTSVIGGSGPLSFGRNTPLDAFQASEVIFRCVDMIASALASLDLVLEDEDGEITGDEITNLFNKASADAENAVIRKRVIWSLLELRGEAFVYMDRGETGEGKVDDFIVIHDPVEPKFDDKAERNDRNLISPPLLGFEVTTPKGKLQLEPSKVLWLRYPDPNNRWGALAPAMAAIIPASLDKAAREFQLNEFANSGTAGVMHLGDVDQDVAQASKAQFEAQATGTQNAGRVVFTYGPTGQPGFSRMGLTPQEMSYLDSHRMNSEDIITAFGIPVDLMFGRNTYENRHSARTELWTEVLLPKKAMVEAEIDRQLYPDQGVSAVFDVSGIQALQESTDAIHDRTLKAVASDLLELGVAQELLGLEPFSDERKAMTLTQYRKGLEAPAPDPLIDGPEPPELPEEEPEEERVIDTHVVEDRAAPKGAVNIDRVLAAYDRHERMMTRAVVRLAEQQERITLRNLERTQRKASNAGLESRAVRPEDIYDEEFWERQTEEALEASMEGLWTDAALATAEALDVKPSPTFLAGVLTSMRSRLKTLASLITRTTATVIAEEVLKEGVEEGESIPELTERIKDRFEDLKEHRATTIARTETLGGHSQAAFMAAVESGFITHKQWMAASDDRVRESHAELDRRAEAVALEDRFSNGLMFPGDPSGEPGESINCRCVIQFLENDVPEERKYNPDQPRDHEGKWTDDYANFPGGPSWASKGKVSGAPVDADSFTPTPKGSPRPRVTPSLQPSLPDEEAAKARFMRGIDAPETEAADVAKAEVSNRIAERLGTAHDEVLFYGYGTSHESAWAVMPNGDLVDLNRSVGSLTSAHDSMEIIRGDDPRVTAYIRAEEVSRVLRVWASTSNDHSAEALAVQEAAKQEFDLANTMDWYIDDERLERDIAGEVRKKGDMYRAVLRAQYEETQAQFAADGITSVSAYRGYAWSGDAIPGWVPLESGTVESPPMRPLSSFSADRVTAAAFAGGIDFPPGSIDFGVVTKTTIPVENILSTPRSGFGALNEFEYVVLASTGEYEVTEP